MARLGEVNDPLELAKAAAAGQATAQRRIYQLLRGAIHATVYRIIGSNRHAEDLVQEVFLQVFRSIGSFKGDSKLTTWAYRITVRVVYRHLQRRELVLVEELQVHATAEPSREEEHVLAREGLRRLFTLMRDMKPEHRIAFTLFKVDGRSLREVADVTGTTVVSAKSRIWRARRWLVGRAGDDPVLCGVLDSLRRSR